MALIDEPITPIPAAIDADPGKVRLGERRFHDPRLSHDNSVACASCHQLDKGGEAGSCATKLPLVTLSLSRLTVFVLLCNSGQEGRQSIIQAMRYFIDLRIVKLPKEC